MITEDPEQHALLRVTIHRKNEVLTTDGQPTIGAGVISDQLMASPCT